MALIRGIHIMAHGQKGLARQIAVDIQQHQRLLVGTASVYGAGAYAWPSDELPDYLQDWPQVVFEIDDSIIKETPRGFFVIPGKIGGYVKIHVIEFLNLY